MIVLVWYESSRDKAICEVESQTAVKLLLSYC